MILRLCFVMPVACAIVSPAFAFDKPPPPELAAFAAAVKRADAMTDPMQRCLAYPDLPGNAWLPGAAKARCIIFNTPAMLTLDAIDAKLKASGGAAALDAQYRTLLDAHFTVPAQREQIFVSMGVFADDARADDAERIARAWMAASPKSPFARTALGKVFANRGWNARGTKLMVDTPRENVHRMMSYFEEARKHLDAALAMEPRMLPACEALMAIGRQTDDSVHAKAAGICLDADPASYFVVEEMMNNAEPRWGGSIREMREVADYATQRQEANPALSVMTLNHESYRAERENDDERALAELQPLALRVPNASYLRKAGGAYLRKDDYWNAFVHLSEALRFMPDYAQESRWRAYVLFKLGEPQWARADAERALALDPADAYAHRMFADILRDTGHRDEASKHYQIAMREPELRKNAYVEFCSTTYDERDKRPFQECTAAQTKEFPDSGAAWYQRLTALGTFDAPGAADAMRHFLATFNPEWPLHVKRAEEVRAYMVRHGLEE